MLTFLSPSTFFRLLRLPCPSLTSPPRRPRCLHASRYQLTSCTSSPDPYSSTFPQDSFADEPVSDDDYVVIDGKDISLLIEELQRSGGDQFDPYGQAGEDHAPYDDFLDLAEKRADEQNGRIPSQTVEHAAHTNKSNSNSGPMVYFQDDHLQYMPQWLADVYKGGNHTEFEEIANKLSNVSGRRRLRDIVERKQAAVGDELVGIDGIVDCTVADVAEDYAVPVEFVVDALLHFGVQLPVELSQSVRDCMTTEEITRLLQLLQSFDAKDLAERYSDRCVREVAETYDLEVGRVIEVCDKEGLYLCLGEETRLSVVKEDRVLDVLLKGKQIGQPYPSALEGLE